MKFHLISSVMDGISNRMRGKIFIFWSLLLTLIAARYYHRLRHIRLENSFCSGYQELREGKCAARLSTCSKLTPSELTYMRQVLCGFRFDPAVQTEPPPPVPFNPYHYFHGYHGHGVGVHGFLGGSGYGYGPGYGYGYGYGQEYEHGYDAHKEKGKHEYHHLKHYHDVHESDIHKYRFVASIYASDRKFLCGGALVSPKTVITSAQCVSQSLEKRKKRQEEEQTPEGEAPAGGDGKLVVRFGEQYLHFNPIYHKIYEYDVESIEVHPNYDPNTLQNDIAVVRLVHPVPICLFPPILIPRKFEYWLDYDHLHSCDATYMGWGLNNQKPYFRAETGQVIPYYHCSKLFSWEPDQLHRSQLCVHSPKGHCITDTGGPLITHNKHGWVLIGILSFGKHCRTHGLPLVFSRITEAFDLIFKYIDIDFNSRNYTHVYPDECHHISHIHGHPYHSPHHKFYPYAGPHEKHEIHPIHEKEVYHHIEKHYDGNEDHPIDENIVHLHSIPVKKYERVPEIVVRGSNHPIEVKDYLEPSKSHSSGILGGALGGILPPFKHIDYEYLK